MTVEHALKAQEQGRIRAILMHQGESEDNQGMSDQWLERVATVVGDLRADLNLGEDVPLPPRAQLPRVSAGLTLNSPIGDRE